MAITESRNVQKWHEGMAEVMRGGGAAADTVNDGPMVAHGCWTDPMRIFLEGVSETNLFALLMRAAARRDQVV